MGLSGSGFITMGNNGNGINFLKSSISPYILDNISLSPNHASSIRKLKADFILSPVRLRRDSDNEEADFLFNSSDQLNTDSISTNSSSGTTDGLAYSAWDPAGLSFLVTFYDQSGNGNDLTQSTAGNQREFMRTSRVDFFGRGDMNLDSGVTISGNYMSFEVGAFFRSVANMTGFNDNGGDWLNIYNQATDEYAYIRNGTGVFLMANTTTQTGADTPVVAGAKYNGTTVTMDGNADNGSQAEGSVPSFTLTKYGQTGSSDNYLSEAILFDDVNDTDYTDIRLDESTFYGITI